MLSNKKKCTDFSFKLSQWAPCGLRAWTNLKEMAQKTNSLCWGGQKSASILMPLITIHYSHTTKIYLTFIHALHSIMPTCSDQPKIMVILHFTRIEGMDLKSCFNSDAPNYNALFLNKNIQISPWRNKAILMQNMW